MKKLIIVIVCLAATLFGCRKENVEFDYSSVKKIVIQGKMTDLDGKPIFRGIIALRSDVKLFSQIRYTDSKGYFSFLIDTADIFLQKRAVNLQGNANLFTTCDSNILKCVREPQFKMPFSLFQQSLKDDTLYLNYDLAMTPLAQLNFTFDGSPIDSVRFQYTMNNCEKGSFRADFTQKVFAKTSLNVSTSPTDFTISGIKNGKVVKIHRFTESLKPLEVKTISLNMDN